MIFARHSARSFTAVSLRASVCKKQLSTSKNLALGRRGSTSRRQTAVSSRLKSTSAATLTDDHDLDDAIIMDPTTGHKAAATARASMDKAHEEAWMINLGRGNENEWLTGTRTEEWFTGVAPPKCPGVDAEGKIRSLPMPNLSRVTRESAKQYFDNSWTLYETLFAGLRGEEGFYRPPPHGLRHPQIFYYGHDAVLFINKLRVAGVLDKPVHPYFESIFEVGVDEMLWDDMHKNDMLWPTVSEVHAYRKDVYETVVNTIMTHPSLDDSDGPVTVNQTHPMWALFMGCEHERIHLETSSVLFRETPLHLVQKPENFPWLHPSAGKETVRSNPVEGSDYPANRLVMAGGNGTVVELGKPPDFPSFGWDNEYGERTVDVPKFFASEHMITNGEFWQFVADGGYRERDYWCDDSWAWRVHRNIKWPFFWQPAGPAGSHEFTLRTIFDLIPMPWDWPVDVNLYEAKAFCRWKTAKEGSPTSKPYRVLTEAEHHVIRHRDHGLEAARKDVSADKVMVAGGNAFAEGSTGSNLNLAFSSQSPVDYFAPSHTGHRDTTGNAWEWTEDHFSPLEGFEVHHVYDDFSTPCFDGKHSMIVGGSFISTGDEASVFARFHFRPHFLQHSGFRLVASEGDAPARHLCAGRFESQVAARDAALPESFAKIESDNVYESESLLNMYFGLHYPSSGTKEGVPAILNRSNAPTHGLNFPQRVANMLVSLKPEKTNGRALDIGCAVGGASFELAKTFEHVDAFDFSESFVEGAKRMQTESEDVRFRIPIEADIFEEVSAVHNEGITLDILQKVDFFTGDACEIGQMAMDGRLSTYDGVVMSNLLCRLPDPSRCLDGLPRLVNKGGVALIVTPFSWLEDYTARSKWLGGFYDPVSGVPLYSKERLQDILENRGFEKIHEEEVPLVIREHQRKYQYIVSLATGWRRE